MSYTLAVRLTAPGWAEAQRFVLQVDGERIADADYRPAEAGPGHLERARSLDPAGAVDLAIGSCAECGQAHGLALGLAFEQLAGSAAPAGTQRLRCAVAELERAAAHLAALASICEALGMARAAARFSSAAAASRAALGPLAVAGLHAPGGPRRGPEAGAIAAAQGSSAELLALLFGAAEGMISQRPLLAATVEVGGLARLAAEQFGLAGPMARASGLAADLRRDRPYGAYGDLQPEPISQEGGDVYARLVQLLLEALESLKLAGRALDGLSTALWRSPYPSAPPDGAGEATVEGPRGPLRYQVSCRGGRIEQISLTAAPQIDRLLARAMLSGSALDDCALIVRSTSPCDGCRSRS